ncbi:hypothetical protein HD554DRAFT_2060725 [Boletus coccyginus]|nr:hypothetical protein HD554DRAFT_2060725 [Boletus coccyginus]
MDTKYRYLRTFSVLTQAIPGYSPDDPCAGGYHFHTLGTPVAIWYPFFQCRDLMAPLSCPRRFGNPALIRLWTRRRDRLYTRPCDAQSSRHTISSDGSCGPHSLSANTLSQSPPYVNYSNPFSNSEHDTQSELPHEEFQHEFGLVWRGCPIRRLLCAIPVDFVALVHVSGAIVLVDPMPEAWSTNP